MSRRKREDAPDAVFHVTARVNWKYWHLAADRPAELFLVRLKEALTLFEMDLLAMVLMSNHYHLVARSPEARVFAELTSRRTACRHRRPYPPSHQKSSVLGQCMHRLMGLTAKDIQAELGLEGHFWDGRYDSVPVRDRRYLLAAIAYDHLNPVREGIVDEADKYDRSSAAWWTGAGDSPIDLVRRPLPFGLGMSSFQRELLRYQTHREFSRAMREVFESPSTRGSVEAVRRRLQELGLDCGTDAAPDPP